MGAWFGLTAFAGAALLFAAEPMAAKALLPMLGGTASVWSASLAFFQSALLLGYFYAHVTSRLTPRAPGRRPSRAPGRVRRAEARRRRRGR